MVREEEIINDAIYNLKRLTNLENIDFKIAEPMYDYDISINGTTFACEVKALVNKANFNLVMQQLRHLGNKTDKPLMLVVRHIIPDLFAHFQQEGISVMESTGNCCITAFPLFMQICGQKNTLPNEAKGKAFNEAGLKVVFYFLLDAANISKPYRTISEETGLSLGTIKNVVEELNRSHYVFTTTKGRIMKNWKELLDVWQTHYNQTLKPKLMVKELEFVDTQNRKDWANIMLPDGMCWGGEGGAFLLDHYLVPERFDIYTEISSIKLVMTKKVRFQDRGSIRIYQKFWKGNINEKVAPKILVYADLMGSGNSRCIEAAQRLIENGI